MVPPVKIASSSGWAWRKTAVSSAVDLVVGTADERTGTGG
jgi:hypothetical protein